MPRLLHQLVGQSFNSNAGKHCFISFSDVWAYTEMMHISSVGIYTGCSAQSEEAGFLIEQYSLTDLLGGLEISFPCGKLTNLWKLFSIVQVFF